MPWLLEGYQFRETPRCRRFRGGSEAHFLQIENGYRHSLVGVFYVSPTVGPLHGCVAAVSAFEVAHSVRVHDFLVSAEFLRRSECSRAVLTSETHILVNVSVVSSSLFLLAKRLFASVVFANQIAGRFHVNHPMSFERVFSN